MKRYVFFLALLVLAAPALSQPASADKRPMTVDDLFRFKRVADPQISPDGKQVVYVVGTVDLDANKISSTLWLASTDGKTRRGSSPTPPRRTAIRAGARTASDPLRVEPLRRRRSSGSSTSPAARPGSSPPSAPEPATAIWSRDGKHDRLRLRRLAGVSPTSRSRRATSSTRSGWTRSRRTRSRRRSSRGSSTATGTATSRTSGSTCSSCDFADGKAASRATSRPATATPIRPRRPSPPATTSPSARMASIWSSPRSRRRDEAWSTNYDICRVPVDGEATKWENLTKDNPAADSGPQFSPDGKQLAYRAQKKAGLRGGQVGHLMVVDVDAGGAFDGQAAKR